MGILDGHETPYEEMKAQLEQLNEGVRRGQTLDRGGRAGHPCYGPYQ